MLKLKFARLEKGLTQKELAEKIGVNLNDISRYETGRMNPTISNLIKLADVLDVSVDYLLGRK